MPPALECTALHAAFGANHVLRGIDLSVEAGELVVVSGANAAGKSTLLRALAGLVSAVGRVAVADRDVSGLRADARARLGIRHVAGGDSVFDTLRVGESLALAARTAGFRGAQARDRVDAELRRLDALGRLRQTGVGALSGGERGLLALAQARVGSPRVLLADEPLRGLAPDVAAVAAGALAELCERGAAVVVVEHAEAGLGSTASRRLHLSEGRL